MLAKDDGESRGNMGDYTKKVGGRLGIGGGVRRVGSEVWNRQKKGGHSSKWRYSLHKGREENRCRAGIKVTTTVKKGKGPEKETDEKSSERESQDKGEEGAWGRQNEGEKWELYVSAVYGKTGHLRGVNGRRDGGRRGTRVRGQRFSNKETAVTEQSLSA